MKENNPIPKGFTWTPVFDHLVNDLGLTQTAIIGVIWRYSQMDEKICRASQDSISLKLGLSRQSLNKHIKELIANGYVIDFSPKLRNRPHFLKLTEKVYKLNKVDTVDEDTLDEIETYPTGEITLSNNEVLLSNNEDLLSIFDLFGVNNLYMKKDNKRDKEREIRNISNNPFVNLLVYDKPISQWYEANNQEIESEVTPWELPDFINYVFTFNILEFEREFHRTFDQEIAQTNYHITEKGIAYLNSFMDAKKAKIDWNFMASVIDFWFWYTLESNDRAENLQQMLSIYNQRSLNIFVKRYPEVYRKSAAVQLITEIIGFDPPDILCPQIFNIFTGFNNLYDIMFIVKEIYAFWLRTGNNPRDFGWLFELFGKEVLPIFDNPKKWWFRYVPREM